MAITQPRFADMTRSPKQLVASNCAVYRALISRALLPFRDASFVHGAEVTANVCKKPGLCRKVVINVVIVIGGFDRILMIHAGWRSRRVLMR